LLCVLVVLTHFGARGTSCGNDPEVIVTRGPTDDEKASESIDAEGNEALL